MNILIKYVIFLMLLTVSFASVSDHCPDADFVKNPSNRWTDGHDAGIKDAPVGFGTLFLAGGPSELNNLDNVTEFQRVQILNAVVTCIYDADVQLVSSLRFRYRPASGIWQNLLCPIGGIKCQVCRFNNNSCQFRFN